MKTTPPVCLSPRAVYLPEYRQFSLRQPLLGQIIRKDGRQGRQKDV